MTKQQKVEQELKYREYRQERLEIFERFAKMGVSESQLRTASAMFDVMADTADEMMELWRGFEKQLKAKLQNA